MAASYDPRPVTERQDHTRQFSPYRHPGTAAPPEQGPRSVLRALFELHSQRDISESLARATYAVVVVGIAITWVAVVVVGFAYGAALGALAILLGWIPALLWVVAARIVLEFSTAVETIIDRPTQRLPEL